MEIKVEPNNWSISLAFSDQAIQFIKYNEDKIFICTKNNEIYESKFNRTKKQITFTKIKNSELINKIKFINIQSGYFIIITEFNEFFLYYDNCFTKLNISFNKAIKYFNITNDLHIVTKDHELFLIADFFSLPFSYKDFKQLELALVNNLFIKEISGFTHLILLDIFGNIYVKGNNELGELGLGDNKSKEKFTKVDLPFKVKKIFADNYCSLIVNENNELFGTGVNDEGQLGLGHNEKVNTFTKIVINNVGKPITSFNFYFSFSSSSVFISDNENNIYISGGTNIGNYGILLKDSDYLMEFTKIDLKLHSKYLNILSLENVVVFIGTNYKINKEDEELDNILGAKCFKVLQNEKLVDLFIYCNDYNIKKRKRNEFY